MEQNFPQNKTIIDNVLLQQIASYLQTRPWAEVNNLIVGLSQAVNNKRNTKTEKKDELPTE